MTKFNDVITNAWKAIKELAQHPDYQQITLAGLLDEPESAIADLFGTLEQIQEAFDQLNK